MNRQSSYTYDELIQCGHGELFGPGNAQLPLPDMLMIDRITNITDNSGEYGRGEILAELDVQRRKDLLAYLTNSDQVMMTTTDLDLFEKAFVDTSTVWQIAAGRVIG